MEKGTKLGGHFNVGGGRLVLGELSADFGKTDLYLHDPEFFNIDDESARGLTGVLHDRTKVTALEFHTRSSLGSATRNGESYRFADLSPAYILSGNRHFPTDAPSITKIIFHLDDAEEVFYDFDVMGHVIDARPLIDKVVEANESYIDRKINTGPAPEIIYFSGRIDLASVDTDIGRVRIFHQPFSSNPLSSPRYAGIRNRTLVEIGFLEPLFLQDALRKVLCLLRFFEVIAGRPQNIDDIQVETVGCEADLPLELHWTHPPHRRADWEERRPHAAEILISIIDNPEHFGAVLAQWVSEEERRIAARVRFSEGFGKQRSFSIDRLVAAANMFDILPPNALPPVNPLSNQLNEAQEKARDLFRKLPASAERESVLSALGRIGGLTLRQKILHRAGIVSSALTEPLARFDIVVDEAVKCRNFYVHGTPGSFSYSDHNSFTSFFTSALEFLFGASDMIDAGWNIQKWRSQGSVGAHPFNNVIYEWRHYADELNLLRASKIADF